MTCFELYRPRARYFSWWWGHDHHGYNHNDVLHDTTKGASFLCSIYILYIWAKDATPWIVYVFICRSAILDKGKDKKGRGFAWAGFGQLDNTKLWRLPRLHVESDSGMQALDGKLTKSIFIWIRNHGHIFSGSAAIVVLVRTPFVWVGAASLYLGPVGRVSSWVH